MAKRIMFVLAAALLVIFGLYVRSQNATSAHNQVSDIVRLDGQGADVSPNIDSLKTYVKNHMGAKAQFTLDGAYQRAQDAAKASAAAATGTGNVYADAYKACAGHTDSITQAKCNQAYIQSHLSSLPSATPVAQPKLADYQYKYTAPLWTPDLAGALLVGALAALVLGLFRLPRRHRR
jgi:hypothetical protein